jgi:tetratricopeptide (TPR) repeat protein
MKRSRISGQKASRKMDAAHDQLLDLARIQLESGDHAGAQRTCTRLLASDSLSRRKRAVALHIRGNAEASLGEYPSATSSFSEALAFAPERADLWYNRSQIAFQLGNNDDAKSDIDQALELDPRNALLLDFQQVVIDAQSSATKTVSRKPNLLAP